MARSRTIPPMNSLELVIRTVGATAAFILGMGLLSARDAPWLGRVCGALMCLGVASYLPCSANWSACWKAPALPASVLASAIPFFFWAWTRSVMDDEFRLTWLPALGGGVLLCLPLLVGMVWPTEYSGWSVAIHSIIGIAFVIAALVDVVRTWREDLIEARRRLRWIVFVVGGAYCIAVMGVELYFREREASSAVQLLNAISLTALL